MAKEKKTPSEGVAESANMNTEIKNSTVHFTPEQLDLVQQLIKASQSKNERGAISMLTGQRDPKKIETVNVSRFDGKFVLGFKDLNKDPYRKVPKYWENKLDINRKLADQPFVTLLLSTDGKDIEEKEVALVDYMNNRIKEPMKVVHIDMKEIIDDHGILGRQGSGGFANAIDENGKLLTPVSIKAESKRVERKFYVELPGFETPVEFIDAFLA